MKKAIVLLSGGIDSATTLYMAREKGFRPHALIFDYGQRHKKEIRAARRIAKKADASLRIVKIPFLKEGSSLLSSKRKLPSGRPESAIRRAVPSTYVPGRNLVFLSVAFSMAESMGASAVFIGAHTEDYSGYPDCRKGFLGALEKAVRKGTKAGRRLKLYAPLINKSKKDIIRTALKLRVPIENTWSCYEGRKTPCGVCDSCFFRSRAFKELGMKDPAHEKS